MYSVEGVQVVWEVEVRGRRARRGMFGNNGVAWDARMVLGIWYLYCMGGGARMHGLHDVDRRRIGDRRGFECEGCARVCEGARDGGCHVLDVLFVVFVLYLLDF